MKKDMGAVSYEREKRLYYAILDHMDRAAYPASSAWCFSRKAGAIDEYIIDNEQYVGLGSGAMGYLNGQMTASSFSINRYLGLVESGFCGITRQVRYTPEDEIRYAFLMAFFGLRVEKAAMRERWGDRFEKTLWKEFVAFRAAGAIRDEGDHWVLTRRGMYLWVLMMRTFFIGVSNFRDLMRHGIKGELDPEDRAGLPAA
jgi:coproporphyrinogen III oxidase-like Fe-S oxidoreductase